MTETADPAVGDGLRAGLCPVRHARRTWRFLLAPRRSLHDGAHRNSASWTQSGVGLSAHPTVEWNELDWEKWNATAAVTGSHASSRRSGRRAGLGNCRSSNTDSPEGERQVAATDAPLAVFDVVLPSSDGRQTRPGSFAGAKATLFLFVSTECPISNGYVPISTGSHASMRIATSRWWPSTRMIGRVSARSRPIVSGIRSSTTS